MRYNKTTQLVAAISIVLACTLCFGGTLSWAYIANPSQEDCANTLSTIPMYDSSSEYDTKQGISVSAYNIYKYIEENEKVNVFIEFKNNTAENIDLLYFNYKAFNSEGIAILTSQNNTNDIGETLAAGKTIRVYLTLPASLSTIDMKITKYQTQDGKLISVPQGADNSYKLDFNSVPSLGKATDISLIDYKFFTIKKTPAIKATFQNNTDLDISSIKVRVKFLDFKNLFYDYTAEMEIKAGESDTHSGWGLANDITSIELGIISYVTTDGTIYQINSDDIEWLKLSL